MVQLMVTSRVPLWLTSSSNKYLILTLKILTTLFESRFSKLTHHTYRAKLKKEGLKLLIFVAKCHTVGPGPCPSHVFCIRTFEYFRPLNHSSHHLIMILRSVQSQAF